MAIGEFECKYHCDGNRGIKIETETTNKHKHFNLLDGIAKDTALANRLNTEEALGSRVSGAFQNP